MMVEVEVAWTTGCGLSRAPLSELPLRSSGTSWPGDTYAIASLNVSKQIVKAISAVGTPGARRVSRLTQWGPGGSSAAAPAGIAAMIRVTTVIMADSRAG